MAPTQSRWPGCSGASTAKSNPHPSIWPPVGGRRCCPSEAGCLSHSCEKHAARGSAEHQMKREGCPRCLEGLSTWGSACKCCKTANTERPHRPDGPEIGGRGICYPQAGLKRLARQEGSSLPCPKGHRVVISCPPLIFSVFFFLFFPILRLFFFKFPGPHRTQGI